MFIQRNIDIRRAKGNIPVWVIAERLGIHEKTLYSWLRHELPENKKNLILNIIQEVKREAERREVRAAN